MKTRNPYNMTRKRKAALAWMAARGITQPRALYPNPLTLPTPARRKLVLVP
jgi:hypothetical protein